MSSISSAESVALASGLSEPECEQSPSARSNRSANESSQSTGLESQSTPTFELSGVPTLGRSKSSAEDSPARTYRLPDRVPGLKEAARDCGPSTHVLLAKCDPATSSWKTSQLCFTGEWAEFSETWPRSGFMQSGTAYQLPTLAPLTPATDYGLLPTVMKGRCGPGGSQGCKTARKLIGRDWYLPEEAELIMGFPIGWTALAPAETPSCPTLPNSSAGRS